MSIVSHELVYTQPNGVRFDVRYKFTFHTGEDVFINKTVEAGFDTDADMLAMIPGIEEDAARKEVITAIGHATDGGNVDITPTHQSQADFDRRVLGEAMKEPDLITFWNTYNSFWGPVQIRGGNNKPQRAAYLGVDTQTYDEIDKRFNDMAGITTLITDEKGRVWDELPDGYW
jgi:hypothetical protein